MTEGQHDLARLGRLRVHRCEHSLALTANAGQLSAFTLQVLLPAARERLARIALVKPDKARGVEDLVLQAAQRGQIVERVCACRPFFLKVKVLFAVNAPRICLVPKAGCAGAARCAAARTAWG